MHYSLLIRNTIAGGRTGAHLPNWQKQVKKSFKQIIWKQKYKAHYMPFRGCWEQSVHSTASATVDSDSSDACIVIKYCVSVKYQAKQTICKHLANANAQNKPSLLKDMGTLGAKSLLKSLSWVETGQRGLVSVYLHYLISCLTWPSRNINNKSQLCLMVVLYNNKWSVDRTKCSLSLNVTHSLCLTFIMV